VRTDQTAREAHINNVSTGDSGDLTLTAKKIVVGSGAQLLAHGDNGKPEETSTSPRATTRARFYSVARQPGRRHRPARRNAEGKDIFLSASADDAYKYTGSEVANTILKQIDNLAYMVDVSISRQGARHAGPERLDRGERQRRHQGHGECRRGNARLSPNASRSLRQGDRQRDGYPRGSVHSRRRVRHGRHGASGGPMSA